MVRACVQYGRFNKMTNTWENQSIWCAPDELRNLAEVLDQLNETNGDSAPEDNSGLEQKKA